MLRFLTPMTASFALGKFALYSGKLLSTLLGIFGIVDHMPIAIGYQIADPQIKSNSIVLLRQWLRRCFTNTLQIPARGAQDKASKLECALQRAMDNDTDTTTTLSRSLKASIIQTVLCITELDRLPR